MERNGGGPPSSFRAEVKVLHGVPQVQIEHDAQRQHSHDLLPHARIHHIHGLEHSFRAEERSTGGKVGTPIS